MRKLEFIIIFQVLLGFNFNYDAESQGVTITSKPLSPLRVLEGHPLTLEWTFSVVTTLLRVELGGSTSRVALVEASPRSSTIRGIFRGRVTASITETNATIAFLSLNRTDTASYVFAVLDNAGYFADVSLQLIVQYPPSLITRAPDQVVLEGDLAIKLICTADGEPVPNITWTKVFDNGSDSDVLFTGEQFILPNNRTRAGTYRCKASNGIASDVNHNVNVVVNFKPEKLVFTVESSNENICKGNVIKITCSAVGKPGVHTYELFRDDTLVHSSDDSVLFWGQETTAGGETVYTCVANNTVATANTTKTITVNEGSAIEQLENVTAVEGMNTALNCIVTGIPMPAVSWIEVKTGNRSFQSPFVFSNVSRKKAGEYICHANNRCGNDSKSGILTVIYPPEGVQLQVREETVCKGENVIFNCSAADANPMELTCHLYENNVVVSNSSSTGIWNRTMITRGVFVYSCKVTNAIGTAMSTDVSVSVNEGSAIKQLENVITVEGMNATLNCPVTGIPMPSVSWLEVKTGNPFSENPLVLANVSRKQAGYYICEANNPCGNHSKKGILTVNYPPEGVQLQVSEDAVCKGANVIFSCSAADANPMELTYHLYENNVMVGNSGSTGIWNRTMTTGGVIIYSCKVTNIVGTAMSTNVSVTVNIPSSILPIDNEVVIEGGNVALTCSASGFPAPTVYWVKTRNGDRLNKTELFFRSINRSEAGEYTCVASNPCSTSTELAEVDVLFPPKMVQLAASETTVCQGEIITLTCSANSNPAVHTYRLYVNGTMMNKVSSTGVWNRTIAVGGVFVYKCTVNNTIGTAMSENVTVTVYEPSSILPITRKVVTEGGNLRVICEASGVPPPTVFWVKTSNLECINGTGLALTNIHRNQSGEYACNAKNPCGDASQSVEIDVQYPPEAVQFQVSKETVCSGTTITFNCSAAGANPRELTYHLYQDNVVIGSGSSTGVWSRPMTAGGVFLHNCVAANNIGTTMSRNISVFVNNPPSIEPLRNLIVKPGDNITLTCVVSGKSSPSVSWTQVSTGIQHHDEAWEVTNIDVHGLGEYRCNASNSCGQNSDKLTLAYVGGKCEEQCKERKTCRYFGKYLCLCERGKKGALCTKTENIAFTVQAGFKLKNEEFRPEYEDLESHRTEKLIDKIEEAIVEELRGSGIANVKIAGLRKGSVIVDVELTFDTKVGVSEVSALLEKAIHDGKLGEFQVSEEVVVTFIKG